jgi:hypothetical protein
MPTATVVPKLIPPRDHPFFDPKTGQLTDLWYEYLKSIDTLLRALRLEIP